MNEIQTRIDALQKELDGLKAAVDTDKEPYEKGELILARDTDSELWTPRCYAGMRKGKVIDICNWPFAQHAKFNPLLMGTKASKEGLEFENGEVVIVSDNGTVWKHARFICFAHRPVDYMVHAIRSTGEGFFKYIRKCP